MSNTINIQLVGVGGQGTLLASEVLSRAAMLAGQDVKKSEIHGMAQRGGSVVSQVRIGEKVFSPIIPDGQTDYLVSFEKLEALRYADTLKAGGVALINAQIIVPVTVSSGQQPWVEDLDTRIETAFPQRHLIDAMTMAKALGNIRTVNMVLTGALSVLLGFDQAIWEQAVAELVPEKHREINMQAFAAGRNIL
ncbi:MAG: indolepyruvate oxidoreductase subunit beta [Armatimonadota bacterium]